MVLVDRGFLGFGVSWREIGKPIKESFWRKREKKKKKKRKTMGLPHQRVGGLNNP